MAKLLFFTDLHLDERPPVARSGSYVEDLFAKLEELRKIAGECDGTVFGGDWFNRQIVSHRLLRRCIQLLRSWPHPVEAILGNHCLPPEQLAGLGRTPIGLLFAAFEQEECLRFLQEDKVVDIADTRIQLSPVQWQHDLEEHPELYGLQRRADVDFAVKVAHGMVMPPGEGWPFPATGMDTIPTVGMDLFLWGHPHWRTGIQRLNDTWFASLGAICRASRSGSDYDRQVSALIVTFTAEGEILFEDRPLQSMRPPEEVFVWHEEADRPVGEMFAGYVAALEGGTEGLQVLSIEDALAALEKTAPPEVAALARGYLERAGL